MANPPVYPKFHPRPPLLPTPATPPTPPPTIVKPPSPAYPLARQPSHGSQITSASNFTGCGFSSHTPPLFDTLSLSRLDLFFPVYGETLENRVASERASERANERKNERASEKPCPGVSQTRSKGQFSSLTRHGICRARCKRCFPSNLLPYFLYFGEILFSILCQAGRVARTSVH